jgi:hypothetical protein
MTTLATAALAGVVMLAGVTGCGSEVATEPAAAETDQTLQADGTGQLGETGQSTDAGQSTDTGQSNSTDSTVDPAGTDTTRSTVDAVGTGDPSRPLKDPEATGRVLARRFLDVLSSPNPTPQLEELLSPAFQLQRSNGTFVDREEYLEQPATVSRYEILEDNFRAYQDGPVLTVRFTVAITETIDGREVRMNEADRLGTFVRSDAGWKLTSWANFNPVVPES